MGVLQGVEAVELSPCVCVGVLAVVTGGQAVVAVGVRAAAVDEVG